MCQRACMPPRPNTHHRITTSKYDNITHPLQSEATSLSAHETHANMFILHNGVAIVWTSGASTQALLMSLYPNDVFVAKKNLPSQEPFTKYPSPPNQTARLRRCCGTCASCMHGYTKERKCVLPELPHNADRRATTVESRKKERKIVS
jgi:hypothetical protein